MEGWDQFKNSIKNIDKYRNYHIKKTAKNKKKLSVKKITAEAHSDIPRSNPERFITEQDILKEMKRESCKKSINLRGLTINDAFEALEQFIKTNYHTNNQDLLVITGKDLHTNNHETIKKLVPEWFRHTKMRHYIAGFCQARSSDGGSGALYVKVKNIHKIKRKQNNLKK